MEIPFTAMRAGPGIKELRFVFQVGLANGIKVSIFGDIVLTFSCVRS
jgi:hypothetical protein